MLGELGGSLSDVFEGSLFGKRNGVIGESHFHSIFSLGQGKPIQDGTLPGVRIT